MLFLTPAILWPAPMFMGESPRSACAREVGLGLERPQSQWGRTLHLMAS